MTAEPEQGAAVSAVTDQLGASTPALPPGLCTLKIVADGFAEISQSLSATPTGGESREFALPLTEYRETIDVEATAGYEAPAIRSAVKTLTPLCGMPQSVSVMTSALIADQRMQSMADVVRLIYAGHRHGAGRREPRHADLPWQQLHVGLLRRRCPR